MRAPRWLRVRMVPCNPFGQALTHGIAATLVFRTKERGITGTAWDRLKNAP